MYSVYFNDVLQNENDVINIYDSISFSIDREDKLNSSERIFRDKCNSDFSFCGCAYDYLYNLFVNDKCEDVILTVYNDAGLLLYKGTIQPTISEFNLGLRVCKTKVRDMSFSSKLHDNMDLEVILSNRNTISCKPIEVNKTILEEAMLGGDEEIISFDILDVIKYIVSYISDNSINVVSDYLSLNGFVITTGYNLYGIADGVMASIYPNVSLKKVFDNLYKFLNLYFSIDSYMDGEQYLRIEPYEYFFNDEVIYSIDELPLNTTHFVDIDRIFSNIKVGNNNNIEKEVFVNGITINPKRYRGFMEFTSTTCRSCGANISNTLDLSGDFIVDHNVITNILRKEYTDKSFIDGIFLIHYNKSTMEMVRTSYVAGGTTYNIVNDIFRNENILNRLLGTKTDCLTVPITDGFYLEKNYTRAASQARDCIVMHFLSYNPSISIIDDNSDMLDTVVKNITIPNLECMPTQTFADNKNTYFTAINAGTYHMELSVIDFKIVDKCELVGTTSTAKLCVYYLVYSNSNLTTCINRYTIIKNINNPCSDVLNFEFNQDVVMAAGNVCVVAHEIIGGGNLPMYFYYDTKMIWKYNYKVGCNNIIAETPNTYPYVLEFDADLCINDYLFLKYNKRGIINVLGVPYYIQNIKYNEKKISSFRLIGNNPLLLQ